MEEKILRTDRDHTETEPRELSGVVIANQGTTAAQTHMDKYTSPQGHGFAAEQANHLYDLLTGQNAELVGLNNAKNGPDRHVNGTYIQTKCCQTAYDSVQAAFENGQYCYLNPDGSPMPLEVPSDQYAKAIKCMERRISNGEVPGVSDPAEAKDIVRKGHFTYEQICNCVKFGTVESLIFDAAQGVIICRNAFGITAVITYARLVWNGALPDIAIEDAVYAGLQASGISFLTSVITSQLMRIKPLQNATTDFASNLVKLMGLNAKKNMLASIVSWMGQTPTENLISAIRGGIVSTVVSTLVLSAKDISNWFRGRISGKQLFKNMATTFAGVAGGTATVLLGSYLLAPIFLSGGVVAIAVTVVTASVGSAVAGSVTNKVLGHFIEDDAVEMVWIIEEVFCRAAQDYLLSEDEVDIILYDLSKKLEGETLLDMFASEDREAFANQLMCGLIERLIRGRSRVGLPRWEDWMRGIGRVFDGGNQTERTYAGGSSQKADPVEIGRELTGREFSPQAARKGMYAAKHMNLTQKSGEAPLISMQADNAETHRRLQEIYLEQSDLIQELDSLLEEGIDN